MVLSGLRLWCPTVPVCLGLGGSQDMGLSSLKLGKTQQTEMSWSLQLRPRGAILSRRRSANHCQSGQGNQSRELGARVHSAEGQGKVTWTIFCHSLLCKMLYLPTPQLYIMNLNSVKCMNCHLTLPNSVCSCLVHSRTKFQVHPKYTQKIRFICHKPCCVGSVNYLNFL